MILRPGYRVRQFWTALGFCPEPVQGAVLKAYLSTVQIELFQRMSGSEQRHAFGVLRTVQKEGHSEPVLAQAALLHDVGKVGGRIRLWHRVATVLLQAIHPALLHRLALNQAGSWRYPFFVQLHHPQCGADLAAGAGTDSLAMALIRMHHAVPEQSGLDAQGQALLAALRSADGEN